MYLRLRALESRPLTLLFVALFLIVVATSPGGLESGDAGVRFETARSWLDGNGGALPADSAAGVRGKDGRLYAYYNLTQSTVLAALLFALRLVHVPRAETVTKFLYSVLLLGLVFAALGVVLRLVGRLLRDDSSAGIAALVLATPLFHYSRIGQEENILALAYAGLLLGMLRVLGRPGDGWLILGFASGLAIATRIASLITVGFVWCVVLSSWLRAIRSPADRTLAIAGTCPVALALIATAAWNWVRFGSVLETGYRWGFVRLGVPMFDFVRWPEHLLALTISPMPGILLYAPILGSAPPCNW